MDKTTILHLFFRTIC